jgi:protease-4
MEGSSDTKVLSELAQAMLEEKKVSRRWSIFFRMLWALLFILFIVSLFSRTEKTLSEHIAVIRLEGVIGLEQKTADRLISALERVEKNTQTKGIIIKANSPGGSPVQSDLAYRAITDFKKRSKIPVYVVAEEMCASGCYYIASAADKIYASPASIIGSIGVIGGGFGFEQAIKKLGIERRVITSGENKGMGDPFLPENPKYITIQKDLLKKIHQQFIDAVEQGRGKTLKKDTPELYSGRIWLGEEAIALGLIDGIGSLKSTAKILAPDVDQLIDITEEDDLLTKMSRVAGTEITANILAHLLDTHKLSI